MGFGRMGNKQRENKLFICVTDPKEMKLKKIENE